MTPARFIASCFGLGRLRPAPGTVGAAFGVICFGWMLAPVGVAYQVLALSVVVAVGVAVASAAERQLQRQDPSEVVIDELAGVWVALLGSQQWVAWVVGFVLFRLFDIWKPFPIRRLERLPAGWGIMADDLAAGGYAWLGTWLVMRWTG